MGLGDGFQISPYPLKIHSLTLEACLFLGQQHLHGPQPLFEDLPALGK